MDTHASPDEVSPSGTWPGFAAMCLGMFMAILDIQVVVTSLPVIQDALKIGADRMSWVQTAYLIAEVIAIPLTGYLTRALTMRGLFIAATGVFTLASIACAASIDFTTLIASRVVQGFAGGVLIPLVFSAVFLLFPQRRQVLPTTAAGLLAVLAPTLGPVVGGWITDSYSWHWLFLINVVPGIVAVLVAALALPREKPHTEILKRLDWPALACLALSLASLEIAVKEAPEQGWLSGVVVGLLALFLIAGLAFVRITLKRERPVVDLRLLADRNFAVGSFLSFTLGMGLFGSTYLMPFFLAFVRNHSAFEIGKIMLVTGIAQMLTAPIAVQLERRIEARLLAATGFAIFALGLAMSYWQTRDTDFDGMFWPQIVRGATIMLCLLPPTRLALAHLAADKVGDGSGLFNLMRNLGGAIGLALIDTVIFTRGPDYADDIMDKLKAGDTETARLLGLAPDEIPEPGDPMGFMSISGDIEQLSVTWAINDAWMMLAGITAVGLVALVFARREAR
jgi:DHA2 family multidrug resistance protein